MAIEGHMRRDEFDLDGSGVRVEWATSSRESPTLVERKGWGHPDTLADDLAERLSRVYSRYTRAEFGAVLHHNFDKLALLGGASEVRYGSGRMLRPVRVLVNGRAARACGDRDIPVDELVRSEVRAFFQERLPELGEHLNIEMNVSSTPSPGAVVTDGARPERDHWFAPRALDDLRERRHLVANDTSLGTGWAPHSRVELFVRTLVDHLSGPSGLRAEHPWCGSDIKVMAYAAEDELDVVLAVPQKSDHVLGRAAYTANKADVLAECHRWATAKLPDMHTRFRLNVRDLPERDELYLTYTGSSIESGDEGVVGRGNRVNGLITPLRAMNMEGANGKNPVYHVGKLYNLAAQRLAERFYEATGEHAEIHLVSATGQRLDRPWRVLVRLGTATLPLDKIRALLLEVLDDFPALTEELLRGDLTLT